MSRSGRRNLVIRPSGSSSWERRPPPDLEPVVLKWWHASWRVPAGESRDVRVLTDASVHLVAEVGNSRVVGVVTGVFSRRLEGVGAVLGIKLQPGALRRLTRLPASAWTDRQAPLRELFPDEVDPLESLATVDPDVERVCGALEAFVRRRLGPADATSRLVQSCRDALEMDADLCRVDHLCSRVGVTRRHLARVFRDAVGVSPKWFIRRHRILDAARRLREGAPIALTELAHELGYFDQSHFHRDFRDTVGESPGEFARGPEG